MKLDGRLILAGFKWLRASGSDIPSCLAVLVAMGFLSAASAALAQSGAPSATVGASPQTDDRFSVHVQTTYTVMENNHFSSPYAGANSLLNFTRPKETFDATLYLGVRPWGGAEIWINPELDQGFGLSDTLGLAGYASGEAYKVGAARPYLRLQRAFLRQTFNLSGDKESVPSDLNQFATDTAKDRLVVTAGKFSVADIFDGSVSAHDARHDFLNWSVLDTGSFDYAADAWGYTMGVAAELTKGDMTARLGLFDMSNVPNSAQLDNFHQIQGIAELEKRYSLGGKAGAVRLTGFLSRARMASFSETLAQTLPGMTPDTAGSRKYRSRSGFAISLDQALTDNLSAFGRLGHSDGRFETYEFTDIDQSLAAGLSLSGKALSKFGWHRDSDAVGLAFVRNDISRTHAAYLAAGGLGPLIGDGQLPQKRPEDIVETYYSLALRTGAALSLDYQFVRNPAYNPERGPVSIVGLRLHAQY